jgi:myosin heavy subunit
MYLEKPIGLLALLDEESLFPRATDETLGWCVIVQLSHVSSF